jgi:hypothetical protein
MRMTWISGKVFSLVAAHGHMRRLGGPKRKHIGVIAQEVEKKQPEAVHRGRDGLRRVDYAALR